MRAVIYARYSPGPQQTELSIEGQVRECTAYIQKKGYELIKVYADRHVTGMSLKKRDEFACLMDDAKAHKFDMVVCYDTARFARDKFDAVVNKKILRQDLGIGIEYATLNAEGPEGRLLESMMEGFNQYYSEELSRKVKRGMYDAAMKGRSLGAPKPLGYKVDAQKRLVIDEAEAAVVRQTFEAYAKGATFTACAEKLNESGYRTAKGNVFTGSGVRRMLTNKKYIGTHMGEANKIPKIIDDALFYEVQKRIGKAEPKSPKAVYPLVGKLICGCCGAHMTGVCGTSKTGRKYFYYRCPRKCRGQRIRQDKLDLYVAEFTREAFISSEALDEIAKRLFAWQEAENASEDVQTSLETTLARTEKALDNIALALAARPSSTTLLKKLDDLELQKHDIEITLAKEKRRRSGLLSEEALREGLEAFIQGFEFEGSEEQDKRLIDALVDTVVLYPDRVQATYTIRGIKNLERLEFAKNGTSSAIRVKGRTLLFAAGGFAVQAVRFDKI